VTAAELFAVADLARQVASAAHDAGVNVIRGVSVRTQVDMIRNVVGGLAAAVGVAQKSLDAIDKLSRIAIEWINLGIPDDDAINTRGIVDDVRAEFGLPAVEDS
jgi:hypothetical protein